MRRIVLIPALIVVAVVWPHPGRLIPADHTSVTPDGGWTAAASNSTGNSVTFSVGNTSSEWESYTLTCTPAAPVASCTPAVPEIGLGPNSSTNVLVSFTTGTGPGSGSVTLTATSQIIPLCEEFECPPDSDAGDFTVSVGPPPPCQTYIANTQYPPTPYYQGTAAITVAWGEVQTGNPPCLENNPPQSSTFRFYLNGVDRTSLFTVNSGGASATLTLSTGGNQLKATITGHDQALVPRTDTDIDSVYAYPGASPQAPFADVQSVNPGAFVARGLCLTVAASSDAAYECGDLRIVHALTTSLSLGKPRTPTLIYNSDQAHPWPVVGINVRLPITATVPDSVVARLLVNGIERRKATWSGSEWALPGTVRRVTLGYDGLSDATGVYPYVVEVTNWYATNQQGPATATGELIVVNRSSSAFGAGWWLAGLERMYSLSGNRKLVVLGDGSARVYNQAQGVPNLYVATNPVHPDSLDGRGVDHVRIAPHGLRVHFRNSDGRHIKTVNRLGHETAFSHVTGGAADGNLGSISTPPAGQGSTYTFFWANPNGTLSEVRVSDLAMHPTLVTMDAGRISKIKEPKGDSVMFNYFWPTMTRRITRRTDRRGHYTTFDYDQTASRKLKSAAVNLAPGQSYPTVFSPAEGLGHPPLASVDTAAAYTRIEGPRLLVADNTDFWLDRFGAPRRVRDALGRVTELSREDGLWPAAVTRMRYPDGRILRATYNANSGLVASVTDSSLCTPSTCAKTSYGYEPKFGFVSMIAPPAGDSSFMVYDTVTGNRTLEYNVRRDTVRYRYANALKLLSSIQRPGQSERDSFTYDARGLLTTSRSPTGRVTTYENSLLGLRWRTTSPGGVINTTYLDYRAGLDTLVTTYGPYRENVSYEIPMQWLAQTASLKKTYDAEGNLIETRRSATGGAVGTIVEQVRYDRYNRPVAQVAADGMVDSTEYDPGSNVVKIIGRRPGWIVQVFDAAGQLTERRVPQAQYFQTSFEGETFPGYTFPGDTIRFFYDAAGRDTLALNRYSQVRRRYVKGGLLTWEEQRVRAWQQRYASTWSSQGFDSHVYALTYDYDLNGRRTQLIHPPALGPGSDSTRYTYHPFGPLATLTDPFGGDFRFFYDAQGRLDSLSYPTTARIGDNRKYDLDGRLKYRTVRPTHPNSGYRDNVIRADTIDYTDDGLVLSVHNAGREWDWFVYSGLGQVGIRIESYIPLILDCQPKPDGFCRAREEYYRPDAMGNVFWRSILTGLDTPMDSFAFQSSTGRMTAQSDKHGGQWQSLPLTYDQAGNQRFSARWHNTVTCLAGDPLICTDYAPRRYKSVTAMAYDMENRLVAVNRRTPAFTYPTENEAGGNELYWYDAYGRRILRHWLSDPYLLNSGQGYQDFHLYRFVWDGDQILYEIRSPLYNEQIADDDLQSTSEFGRVGYVHGPGIDSPLEAYRADGALLFDRMFLHSNWRGSITLGSLEDGTKDRPNPNYSVQMIDWDRYNTSTYGSRGKVFLTNQYRYFYGTLLAQQVDGSHLQYLRNRYYDSETGRFTQEDPIGLAGGLNVYGFANGDPVNFSDPFGLKPACPPCWEDGERRWTLWIDERFDRALEITRKGIEGVNRLIDQIPVIGSTTRAATGLTPEGADLSGGERALALGDAVFEAGGFLFTGGAGRLTTPQATDLARYLGYAGRVRGAPFNSMGQAVFTNGRNYITPDVTGHGGGVWKMFDLSGNRLGTFDELLNLLRK